MESTVCLLMLLAIPMQAICQMNPPDIFPSYSSSTDADIEDTLNKIRDACPPFGSSENRYSVKVLGATSPPIGGCAFMAPVRQEIIPSFNLWLSNIQTTGGKCGDHGLDHYSLECLGKKPLIVEDNGIRGWYVMLYDRSAKWFGYRDYICALYKTINDDPLMIQMVISGNRSCDGLSEKLEEAEHTTVPEGLRHFTDGSIALQFSKDVLKTRKWREKRSTLLGGECRFPDWAQGSWSDLQVDGNMARYDSAFHEKDDVDYGQESDDGKDGDAETTGGEQYIQRLQRHAPDGISGRNRRSIPYINGVKMYRTWTGTNRNNTSDKDWLKHQLFNDNMRIFDIFHSRRERRSLSSVEPKPLSDINMQSAETVESPSRFEYGVYNTTTPQDDTEDLDEQLKFLSDFDQFRRQWEVKYELYHGEEGKNNEKKRCYCQNDVEVFKPIKYMDAMELLDEMHKYYATTQKNSADLNQKSSPFDFDQLRKKRDLKNEHDHSDGDSKHRKKRCWGSSDDDTKTTTFKTIESTFYVGNVPPTVDPKRTVTHYHVFTFPPGHPNRYIPNNPKRKMRSVDADLDSKSKNTEDDEKSQNNSKSTEDDEQSQNKNSKITDKFNEVMRWWKIIKNHPTFTHNSWVQTMKTIEDFKKKQRYLNHKLNYEKSDAKNKKKRCHCYNDDEIFAPLNFRNPFEIVETSQKNTPDLNQKSNSPFGFDQLRKKRDLKNEHDHGEGGTKNRQKRCWDSKTTTSTERYRDLEFENPPKKWDPMEPFSKTNKYFGTTSNPAGPNRKRRYVDESWEKSKRNTADSNQKSNSPFGFDQLRKKRDLKNEHDHGEGGTKNRQKRCWDSKTTTSTERYRDLEFENPPKKWDPMEPFSKTNKYFGTTSNPAGPNRKRRYVDESWEKSKRNTADSNKKSIFMFDFDQLRNKRHIIPIKDNETTEDYSYVKKYYSPIKGDLVEQLSKTYSNKEYFGTKFNPVGPNRKRRSVDEDFDSKSMNKNEDEEADLKRIKILNQVNGFIRWWNIMRAISTTGYHHSLKHSNGDIKENGYEIFPEATPVPSPVKYLEFAKIQGIPYNDAIIKWRTLERAQRKREAEKDYATYPGQNHPDIVMRDFDQTFDGIEYDFNPLYPEGTAEDPTAYRALTLPGGFQLEPRLSRRIAFEQKQSRDVLQSTTMFSQDSNYLNTNTDQGNILNINRRMKRSSAQQNHQQRATTKFTWRCMMTVDNDEKQAQQLETGAKFFTYGGRIVEKNEPTDNDQHNTQESDTLVDIKEDSKMSYGCLWLVPRGPNILEFSIIRTGMPETNQDIKSFARQLCSENQAIGRDSVVRTHKKLRPRRPWWVTETRTDDRKRVPVGCPVPPGIVFYGVVPAPPPPSTVSTNKAQPAPLRLCARLVSSADDCTTGQTVPSDQMKYTVSECVEQDSLTGTSPPTVVGPQIIFEASRGYSLGGNWRRNKRNPALTDPSTVVSSVAIKTTSTDMPILPFSGHNLSTSAIDDITNHQTIGSTATFSTAMTSSSIISSSYDGQHFADITTIKPTNFTTPTTTATTFSEATLSTLPLTSPQETTSVKRLLPSLSMSSTTTTTTTIPSTSTATVPTTSFYNPVTDYHYRQQQQWQQQHQQPNNNNDNYYYRGRPQHYPPPLPGSTSTDYNNYYLQRQQQQWQQQNPQTQSHWSPQQHPIAANDYSNGYQQQQTTSSGGRRTDDYYYRQQQQNYHNYQYNNDRQQQMPQQRNLSLTLHHPNHGSWNVHGDRPLYISSDGRDDNNRDAVVSRNSSTSVRSRNNGGWTTVEQQHWWYQQQQQQKRQQEQQQEQQQQQPQHWQQQNNRGLGGILSLPPVQLPPLHAEQGAVTVSMPTPLPLHPRRQQKPPNHYYLPTLTTKTSSQLHQLRSKSESRYYEEREYQCIGQWTEPQQQISPVAGEKPVMLTYTYVKRLSPITKEGAKYECFVGTPIPNDEGLNSETTTTLLLTEAGTGTRCSRLADPYRSGMKLVGTKINKEGACKGSAQLAQDTAGGSWYSIKPQPISPSIPNTENGGGTWYAAPPVPVVVQGPSTMMPILTGRHTGGNGAVFTSRQNEQTPRTQSANPPPKNSHSIRIVADKRIIILLSVILFTGHVNNIVRRFFN